MTQPQDVTVFLKKAKSLIQLGPMCRTMWDTRDENWDAWMDLMMNPSEVWDVICGLTYRNYLAGPTPDDNPKRGWTVWEFCVNVNERPVYVKLSVVRDRRSNREKVVCLSFHWPRFPVQLPFKR